MDMTLPFPSYKSLWPGFTHAWHVVWSSKCVRLLHRVLTSSPPSRTGYYEAGWEGELLASGNPLLDLRVWPRHHQGCRGWMAGLEPPLLLQVFPIVLRGGLPERTTRAAELSAIPKPSCKPVWWGLHLGHLHGSQAAAVPTWGPVAGLCLSDKLSVRPLPNQGLQSL